MKYSEVLEDINKIVSEDTILNWANKNNIKGNTIEKYIEYLKQNKLDLSFLDSEVYVSMLNNFELITTILTTMQSNMEKLTSLYITIKNFFKENGNEKSNSDL